MASSSSSSSNLPSKANTTFSLALLKKLSEDDKTANIFYSPFSISSALAIVILGASGNTSTQMSEVLCFTEPEQPQEAEPQQMQLRSQSPIHSLMQTRTRPQIQPTSKLPKYLLKCLKADNEKDDVHANFTQLLSQLVKEDAPYALSIANRLYGEQSYKFLEDFLAGTKKHYNAELESVDFKSSAEEARLNINDWVEKNTQGKIKDLLVQDAVDDKTKLVLVNAIYFKGNWSKKFNEDLTADDQFKINKNDVKPVKMMGQKSKFPFATIPEANCQILELPYEGKDLSMLIILPNEIEDETTGLEKLESELTYERFMEWTCPKMMSEIVVGVKLPRFKMEETYDMKDVLISMGMVDAFDVAKSDFSDMSQANDLVLSQVFHKAVVEVNEEGTEAAASSAAVMTERSAVIETNFFADHPFLFFIRHNPSMSVLFAGRYCSPDCVQLPYSMSCPSFFCRKTKNTMASPAPLSKANTTFSLALLKCLGDNDKSANVFYSPFSISSALAMVMLGARGNTSTQMSEVLCFTEAEKPALEAAPELQMMMMQQTVQSSLPKFLQCLKTQQCDEVHTSFGQLLSELNKQDAPYALSVANRLYGEQSYQFVEDFLAGTRKNYNAELEAVDFITSYEAARLNINGWVENTTQGKIKDILAQGVLDQFTRLVLVNAIYFKGNWDKKFMESSTRDAQFSLNKKAKKSVKMMHQKAKFPITFISGANCQILELPYKGKELSMLIFLPMSIEDNSTGLEKLESQLSYETFVEWTHPDMMDTVEVQVGLPRFKMEEKYDMKNVLISMGMVDAFSAEMSDFSGMSPANDLVLSKVIHKAFVEVNEEGTEAAAATAAIMMLRCAMRPATFIADHPFLFFIRHNPSMSVLFAGRYCSPE
ncbi:serpin peptidase inhibitor, clade B (ovalbumin), member 1, like 3 [Aulostomus maculatus]